MDRARLEAAIWQAFRHLRPPYSNPPKAVDEILRAADAYARHQGGLTAQRRAELEQAVREAAAERRAS